MARARVITVVTGNRAEFGLLEPVMRAIVVCGQQRLALGVIATGTHLTRGTWRDITRAGYTINAKVPMQRRSEVGRAADVAALGRGIAGIGRVLVRQRSDVVLVLGDRIEALAGACAASVGGFRLAHIHGGDRAEGVTDESMRHAISKLAHLHFAATAGSRRRLIRMGEDARGVFNIGSPALDGLNEVIAAKDGPELIVMQHPIGGTDDQERGWMRGTLQATARLDRLVLAPNSDPGSEGVRRAIKDEKADLVEHLPRPEFLSVLAGAKAIVGNSSAGLIEAAMLKRPCVNIGPRQAGREKPGNVIDCPYGRQSVKATVEAALELDLRRMRHPYGKGRTGRRIAETLATLNLDEVLVRKRNSY